MNINFKNILAGVGSLSVLVFILILGLFSRADFGILNKDDLVDQDADSGELICPFDNYDLFSNYPIPTNSLSKNGSSITLDNNGKIFSIFTGNNEIEKFDKEDGKNYSVFIDSTKYKEQSFDLVGMYIDETRGIVYIPGDRLLSKVYRYDLSGSPLSPAYFDNIYAKSIDGYNEYLFVLASDNTGIKKLDLNGKLKKQNPLIHKLDIYPDMAVGHDGTIYVPMNVEKGIFEKNSKTGKYDVLVGYEYVSTILRYDQNLIMIDSKVEDSPFYKRQEKREIKGGVVQKFKEEEKEQTFARINIDKDGNLNLLLKNRTDLDTNGYSRQNVFKIYNKDGSLIKEWSAPGYHFYDFDMDNDGNFFAVSSANIYKFITKCGEISITKNVDTNALDVFTFTKDFLDKNNFNLQDKSKITFDIWEPFDENYTFTVREELHSKYDPSVSCIDASAKTFVNQNIVRIKLNSENKGEVSCVFLNEAKKGKLIIKKIEEPNTEKSFIFELIDPANLVDGVLENFSLKNGEEKEFNLDDGIYNIRERDVFTFGYTTKIECEVDGRSLYRPFVSKKIIDENNPSLTTDTEVQVYMQRGTVIFCTFINTKTGNLVGTPKIESLDSVGE